MVQIPDHPIIRQIERDGYPADLVDDGFSIPDEIQSEDFDEEELSEEEINPAALIAITQLPQIKENLQALQERWEQKAKDAAALVATDESIQAVKQMRADMRKEFDEADTQRKAVKLRYMEAWTEVEKVWKRCVAEPFKRADASYKGTIDGFEDSIKANCRMELERYYTELCAVYSIEFLDFDKAMNISKLKIGMADAKSKTPRRLMDGLSALLARVAEDVERIKQMDDAPEIMAEYKQSFDVGHSVACVQGRKRRVELERQAAETRKAAQAPKTAPNEQVNVVAAPTPIKPVKTASESVYDEFTFTVYGCTRSQLIKIREFLKQEGIKYE